MSPRVEDDPPKENPEPSPKSTSASSAGTDGGVKPPSDVLSPKDASKQLQREFSSRDPEKVFKVQEMLGEGASGAVFRAVHRETKKVVAIKKMQVGVNNITSTVKEIKIMKDLKSPFTLKYYGCYQKDDYIWIIMEYCDGGSVQDMIDMRENEDVCLTELQIAQITGQVLKALEYLHGLKKIHRDIKAGNILVNSRGMAKLADFGISAQQVGDEKRTTTIGSSYWMAPETLMGGGYDSKADIWSLGITLMEMAEGIPPLIEEQPHKAAFRIVNDPPPKLSRPDQWSPQFNDFLARCLTKNPDKRPTAAELLEHPFVKGADGQTKELLELLLWVDKHKKKGKKKSGLKAVLGGGSKTDLEEEATLTIHFGEDSAAHISLLVASHVTTEDICRQCSEQFKISKEAKAYSLYLVVDDGTGKPKEKALGQFDYPVKQFSHVAKKLKKSKVKDPVKLIYKT
jgi:serine/threonine protein kinase